MVDNNSLTVEQKFAKIMLHLRALRPFYSAVYEVIEKHKNSQIGTIGVTTNTLVYNEEFIDKTSYPELVFIILHEIAHIALMHVARRENREPKLWNIACDLYINKLLADEFNINPGMTANVLGIDITMPMDGYYCSSIDTNIDFSEKIYSSLEEQGKTNGYFNNSNENGRYYFEYTGSDRSGFYKETLKVSVTKDNSGMDLQDTGEDISIKTQKSEKIVSDALVRVEMSSNTHGDGTNGLMGVVKNMLKSELDWKKLLKKYMIQSTSTDSSFSRPDKRMYYQKSIYPGQVQDEENTIKGIKVCIDTSGSISDDDIAYFCGQVYDLTKKFKIDAELIYWDAIVQSTGKFAGYKEFERISLIGRGGTDPSVVFQYFDSKECNIKPVVTLMFTDGYFSTDEITPRQRKKYKDTIWIMTREYNKNFKPPFGRKAIAKFN